MKEAKGFKIGIKNANDPSKTYQFVNSDSVSETESMKYMNSKANVASDNLVELVVLNEPEILQCLENRYMQDKIYTYTGPILIALNPFKALPAVYNKEVLEFYYNFGIARSNALLQQVTMPEAPPHVYAVADKSYRDMMRGVESNYSGKVCTDFDQSILISGESGAGKTESTKLIMQYITIISSENRTATDNATVMDRVLLSNPILEAFGNAKTMRNDNSSRFGKFIQLKFNRKGFLVAGYIQTYMLEKIRVVGQQAGERNYHIFYQLAAGGSPEERKRWGIQRIEDFNYANQGGVFKLATIDDAKSMGDLRDAFDAFDLRKQDQAVVLDMVAAMMQLGNIQFSPDSDGEGSVIANQTAVKESLQTACRLLGVALEDMTATLVFKTLLVEKSKVFKPLNTNAASDARDAIVKAVYSALFDWLVASINQQLVEHDSEVQAEIGILDIFGFEYFKTNSFEQLCINYANEALQQHFVNFVFEFEQREYREEGIEFNFVEFKNNKETLELIEAKGRGILSMIDDECFIPRGSDANLAQRMYASLVHESSFAFSAANKTRNEFVVHHFAGSVTYTCTTFTDKNKNEFPANALELLCGSSIKLIPVILVSSTVDVGGSNSPTGTGSLRPGKGESGRASMGGKGARNKTICSQFKEQLTALMVKIQSTTAHYVRCIKPNDQARSGLVNRCRVVEQLKCAGVLEVVRLARSGYPYRMTHEEFFHRFRPVLTPDREKRMQVSVPKTLAASKFKDSGDACMALLDVLFDLLFKTSKATFSQAYTCQKGRSKIFMPKDTYNLLEGARARLVYESSTKIQALGRGFRYRRWFLRARVSGKRIRRFLRNKAFKRAVMFRVFKKREAKRKAEAELKQRADAERAAALAKKSVPPQTTNGAAPSVPTPTVVPSAPVSSGPAPAVIEDDMSYFSAGDTWRAKQEKKLELSRVKPTTQIGPKAIAAPKKVEEEEPRQLKVPISLLQVHHKKSTELEKSLYQEQFPSQWSTDRLLKFFQRDNIEDSEAQALKDSATQLRKFPNEKEYTAGQVKLIRVIGATELVLNKPMVASIAAEIQASGDYLAQKAIQLWQKTYTAEGDFSHPSGHIYEAKNIDGSRCFCKQFGPIGFMFGTREANLIRILREKWQERHRDQLRGGIESFPFPVLLGFLRTDKEITEPLFRKRWMKNFVEASPPEEGELWLIFAWDKCSFRSLRAFAELPAPSGSFSSKSQQVLTEQKWRFVRRAMRLSLEAVEFIHSCGYAHCALSAEAIWLKTFDPADYRDLMVKINELGMSEKLSDLGPPEKGKAKIEEDLRSLGFVFLSIVMATFSTKNKADVKELRAKLAGVNPDSLDSLSSTFNIDQAPINFKELQRVFHDMAHSNIDEFEKVLRSVGSWRTPLTMLFGDLNGAGWKLITKLVLGSKSPLKTSELLDSLDKPEEKPKGMLSFMMGGR